MNTRSSDSLAELSPIEEEDSICSSKDKQPIVITKADADEGSWLTLTCKYLPQLICLTIFVTVTLFCLLDFKDVSTTFHAFIKWTQEHPFKAISAIVGLYSF